MPGNQKRTGSAKKKRTGSAKGELSPVSSLLVSISSVLSSEGEDIQHKTEKVIVLRHIFYLKTI